MFLWKTDKDKKPKFNLEKHLLATAGKYCENMGEELKKTILSRITCAEGNKGIKGKKNYKIKDLAYFPTDKKIKRMEEKGKLWADKVNLPKQSGLFTFLRRHKKYDEDALRAEVKKNEEAVEKINQIIKKLANSDSKVGNDLKELLNHTNLTVRIKKWGCLNASVAFKKGEDRGQKNKAVLFVSDEFFKGTNYHEALEGFLSHEMGHLLEFDGRPKGHKTEYMDGCETAADIIGTQLAVNAGCDPRPFGKFMGDHARTTGIVYDGTPEGEFREETFNAAYQAISNSTPDKAKKSGQNMFEKVCSLSGRHQLSPAARCGLQPKSPSQKLSGLTYASKSQLSR